MSCEESLQTLIQSGFDPQLNHIETLTSSVTTAWGVEWDEVLIARDIMQNFFDANRTQLDKVKTLTEGTKVTISAPASFNLKRLFYLGSEKSRDDIGQYGEGFKAAIMCLLRDHRVEPIAVSGNDIVYFRIAKEPVQGTSLRPIVYDFFHSKKYHDGSCLILRGCSRKLIEALETGLDHFLHDQNPLIGEKLWSSYDDNFAIYRSTTERGHVFYRKLKRGEIPDIPLILVVGKEYAVMEKKIKKDRDRNAFGDALMKTFYNIVCRYGTRDTASAQRIIVEAARSCWTRGHALLHEIAQRPGHGIRWSKKDTEAVFGDTYFARSCCHNEIQRMECEKMEREWEKRGLLSLPAYFSNFGLLNAEQYLKDCKEKAIQEAKTRHSRQLTMAEMNCIEVLRELAHDLDAGMMEVLRRGKATYCVADTEVLLGQLKKDRKWGSYEVFLAASVFLTDFSEAISVFLHEHSHIFGRDGSREFTDALTRLLEIVIRNRQDLDTYQACWNEARSKVIAERKNSESNNSETMERLLDSKNASELRDLLNRVPRATLKHLLESDNAVAAYHKSPQSL